MAFAGFKVFWRASVVRGSNYLWGGEARGPPGAV